MLIFKVGIFLVHSIEVDTWRVHVYLSVNTNSMTIDLFVSLDHNVSTLVRGCGWVCEWVYEKRERVMLNWSVEHGNHITRTKDTSRGPILIGPRGHKEFGCGGLNRDRTPQHPPPHVCPFPAIFHLLFASFPRLGMAWCRLRLMDSENYNYSIAFIQRGTTSSCVIWLYFKRLKSSCVIWLYF